MRAGPPRMLIDHHWAGLAGHRTPHSQGWSWRHFPASKAGHLWVSSVAQLCLTLCDPMDCSTPGFPGHHQLVELAQTQIHRIGDAIPTSHPLSSPSPPAFSLSQHQGLLQWVSSSHKVAKVLQLQFQHQSFQSIFRFDFLWDWLVWSPCCPRDSQVFSYAIVRKHQFFGAQPSLWFTSRIHT